MAKKLKWWQTQATQDELQEQLLVYSRRQYRLILTDAIPTGQTSFIQRTVEVNPETLKFPAKATTRSKIRHVISQRVEWEKKVTQTILMHEVGHIRFSGTKPALPMLGWLWNVLEDERIERLMSQSYQHLAADFEFLNDACLRISRRTKEILHGCLLWRWEWDLPLNLRKFRPVGSTKKLWEEEIRPRVEQSWQAATSDEVTTLAREILDILQIPEITPAPLLVVIISAPNDSRDALNDPIDVLIPNPIDTPDQPGAGGKPIPQAQVLVLNAPPSPPVKPASSPAHLEILARSLALALHPPMPKLRWRPHPSRGYLNLERALEGHARPFDYRSGSAPARSVAILALVDQSGSMQHYIAGVVQGLLLLERACELAGVHFGVWGFDFHPEPTVHRPFMVGPHAPGHQNLLQLGATGGGTILYPVLAKAVNTLSHRPESLRILLVFHDGAIDPKDAEQVKGLNFNRLFLQPVFIGADLEAKQRNQELFGQLLYCPDTKELCEKLRLWLQNLLGG